MNQQEATDVVKAIFDKLRAQLLSQVESLGLPADQTAAAKRNIKDRTSESWNRVTELVNKLTVK